MNTYLNKDRRRQRGLAIVEMAITAPLLIFVMLATSEVTRVFIDHNTLIKAVRVGARHAAAKAISDTTQVVKITPTLAGEIRNLVVYGEINSNGATAVLPGLDTANVSINNTPGSDDIEVSVSYPVTGILGTALPALYGSGIGLGFNLQATVTMRAL